jgi:ABC-type uncharacterized transport system involved in gliding motility auxiliary subunit
MAMNDDLRMRLAPAFYGLAAIFLLGCGAWYVVNRQFDAYEKVGLALVVLSLAAAVLLDPVRLRRALSGRQVRYGSNAVLVSLATLGILIVVNYLGYTNPKQWDLTEDSQFSLAPETKLLLSQLNTPVTIKGFYTSNNSSARDNIRPLLEQYRIQSKGKLSYQFIDPLSNPVAADQYGVTRDGSLVVIIGQGSEVLSASTEQEISGAIIRLSNPEQRKVYFLSGEGEHDIQSTDNIGYSQLRTALQSKNYQVDTLNLLATPSIPKDALELVVAGATVSLNADEVKLISDYLAGGGALVYLAEPTVSMKTGAGQNDPMVDYLTATWGLQLQDDVVVDLGSSLPFAGIAVSYGSHPITDRLGNLATVFPSARSLTIHPVDNPDITQTALASTGSNSWGETDLAAVVNQAQIQFDQGKDFAGPLTLVAAANDAKTKARLVVFGDSDLASDANFFVVGNGDLVVNSIDWAGGQEQLIDLTPKNSTSRFVNPPSTRTAGLIFLLTVIVMPLGVVGIGVGTWWSRRKQT